MGAKVLIVGGGGREHALAWKLKQSKKVSELFVAPGNGGTADIATNVDIGFTDVDGLLKFAQAHSIDLTVIGQEAASDAGVVDAFLDAGLKIFGPTKAACRIESSKAFSKDLMREQHIPTAEFQNFEDPIAALDYIKNKSLPIVIKASGLAEGKGVIIAEDLQTAEQAIDDIMVKKIFGDSGNQVVVEEFLSGQEVSTHALCDGKHSILFPTSQDHKQVLNGGKGPNTGGMGVVAPVPWVSKEQMKFVEEKVVVPTLRGLESKNSAFKGCLYPGLMIAEGGSKSIDDDDVKVLEFNARFGDPEAETYMRLLESDLYDILIDCVEGNLDPSKVVWKSGAAISVAAVSGGYPGKYPKGLPISGIEKAEARDDIVVLQAGTKKDGDQLVTNGGRVLYVTAYGKNVKDARAKAYEAIKEIKFEGMHYRTDIGLAAEQSEATHN